jgi:hypothetical protein
MNLHSPPLCAQYRCDSGRVQNESSQLTRDLA